MCRMASHGYEAQTRPALFTIIIWAWSNTTEAFWTLAEVSIIHEPRDQVGQGVRGRE